jgi:hypothetical protein
MNNRQINIDLRAMVDGNTFLLNVCQSPAQQFLGIPELASSNIGPGVDSLVRLYRGGGEKEIFLPD